jgi:hypothetical protein
MSNGSEAAMPLSATIFQIIAAGLVISVSGFMSASKKGTRKTLIATTCAGLTLAIVATVSYSDQLSVSALVTRAGLWSAISLLAGFGITRLGSGV